MPLRISTEHVVYAFDRTTAPVAAIDPEDEVCSIEGIFMKHYYRKDVPGPIWPAHAICLGANVYILEGLGNLESIVGKRVRFSALPLPVPGSSGSPVRAVAWEE